LASPGRWRCEQGQSRGRAKREEQRRGKSRVAVE
jgi:hypothetical protein